MIPVELGFFLFSLFRLYSNLRNYSFHEIFLKLALYWGSYYHSTYTRYKQKQVFPAN
jgi:hypothetical protein